MVEFRKARREEADDIIDFINYVFSEAHEPHNFKARNPRMYDSDYPFWDDHYVAVDDGRIRATISVTRSQVVRAGETLVYGHVGQVSVHPYHRSKGYMRVLMDMAIADMRAAGFDYSNLNGQRQRYEYFGYVPGNYRYIFSVNSTNIRHALASRAPGVTLEKTENGFAVLKSGEVVGSISGSGPVLTDYSLTADAIGAYLTATGKRELGIPVEFYDLERAHALSALCENVTVAQACQIQIFRFRRCLEAGLKLRAAAGLCADGSVTIRVGDECFGLSVSGREAASFDACQADYEFEPLELQKLVLSLTGAATDPRFPRGWFPLSF